MNMAIAKIFATDRGGERNVLGTAFAISSELGLTAYHCIGDRVGAQVKERRVRLSFVNGESLDAEYADGDPEADFALLRFLSPLPETSTRIPIALDAFANARFRCPGYPAGVPRPSIVTITGSVSEPDAGLESARVLQLFADQSAAGLSLHGMSGAPILVGMPEAAIGLVRWNPQRQDDRALAVGGMVYACPIKTIVERCPELGPTVVEVSPPLEQQLNLVLRQLEIKTVADAFTRSVAKDDDRRRVATVITRMERLLREAGQEASAENYYKLGMLHTAVGQLKEAEASLIAATTTDPEMGKAYLGLATAYQVQANEMIRSQKPALAEELLKKSEENYRTAFQYGFEDPMLQNQLGYTYKEFALWHASKFEEHLENALKNFRMALGANDNDPSAHNGIGNVYALRKDYDNAIIESRRAIEIAPQYLYALFDLCLAYYGKATASRNVVVRAESLNVDASQFLQAFFAQQIAVYAEALRGFLETYTKIADLDQQRDSGRLPPGAQQNLDDIFGWVIRQTEAVGKLTSLVHNEPEQ
jgi:tetratricopeptide (TPR) repeat protein